MNRRTFIETAGVSLAFTVVPRHVLGGKGYIPPSDKLVLGYIGCGTQGLREMTGLLANPEIQIVTVCDPNKFSEDYIDWSLYGIRDSIRKLLDDSSWGSGFKGVMGGRDIGKEVVEKYYAKNTPSGKFNGCTSYSDFRELLEKEKDMDAVKVMTPDHLHATVSIAAMKKGKHVVIHKPIANRIYEARLTIETARKTKKKTHLLAWSKRSGTQLIKNWIEEGVIGTLKEIHNWSNRPVWPQWTANPVDQPPVPEGMDWDLWLGPVPDRPYHPHYTHAVFRGWYDFGAGSIADMGTYSLWPLFLEFGIDQPPVSVEAYGTTTSEVENFVSRPHRNEVAFPQSTLVKFKMPSQNNWPAFQLFWYDGGMKPICPEEVEVDGKELPREGMMLVGDKGKILAGFRGENPQIIPEASMKNYLGNKTLPEDTSERGDKVWINAFKNDAESPGSFLKAGCVTETILLSAVALRAGKRIQYRSNDMKIPNLPEAEKYLYREYRKGWEL